jgi:hypothetical protein
MSREYVIRDWVKPTGKLQELEITDQVFREAAAAKAYLIDLIAIEDLFDQFMENYMEYETDVLHLAQPQLREMIWT